MQTERSEPRQRIVETAEMAIKRKAMKEYKLYVKEGFCNTEDEFKFYDTETGRTLVYAEKAPRGFASFDGSLSKIEKAWFLSSVLSVEKAEFENNNEFYFDKVKEILDEFEANLKKALEETKGESKQ